MRELPPSVAGSRLASTVATATLAGVVGGSAAAILVVLITEMIKVLLSVVSRQDTWVLILMPLVGLTLSVLVLYGLGLSSDAQNVAAAAVGGRLANLSAWRRALGSER